MSDFRRRLMMNTGDPLAILSSEAVAGDIACYNKTLDKIVIIPYNTFISDTFVTDNYEPIGVVAIPGSHNLYNNNCCGVVSLTTMNDDTPNTGTNTEKYDPDIFWGGNYTYNDRYNYFVTVGSNGVVYDYITDRALDAYICSDAFVSVQNPYDTDAYYLYNDNDKYVPSPYLTNDNKNTIYFQTTEPANIYNALSDVKGKDNTEVLINTVTGQPNWKTDATIENNKRSGFCPAACCCWRFCPQGTKQGDWYLPACGEIGYLMVKLQKLNDVIKQIELKYPNVYIRRLNSNYLTSSEAVESNKYMLLHLSSGRFSIAEKTVAQKCRAFLQI